MTPALRLVVILAVTFGLQAASIVGPSAGLGEHADSSAMKLCSSLRSAASKAAAGAELRLPDGERALAFDAFASSRDAFVRSSGFRALRHRAPLIDQRSIIRLMYRGAGAPHSADDPPERPRSLS